MRVGPRTLLTAGAATLALGNLGRIPGGILGGRSAPVGLNDLLLVPLWLTLLAVAARRLRPWPADRVTRWTLGFTFVGVLSLAQAASLWNLGAVDALGPAAFLVRWVLYAGWYWLATVCLSPVEAQQGVRLFERAIYVIAAFGIVQSATVPGFAQQLAFGGSEKAWDEQGRRLVSTLLDPNFAGILIVIALLLALAREREGVSGRRFVIPLLVVALLLTLSRSSILALAVGVVVLLHARGMDRRIAGIFLGGSLLLLPFMTLLQRFAEGFHKIGLDASALQRLVPWTRALIMVTDHPILGVGFNAIKQAQRAYGWSPIGGADVSLDGGLLFVGAMTGVVGVVVYSGLLLSAVRSCRYVYRRSTDAGERALAAGTAAATVAVVVHSFFSNSLLLPFVMQVLWLLWGCAAVMGRSLRVARAEVAMRAGVLTRAALIAPVGLLVPVALLVLTSCEPCSGVSPCSVHPTMALTGQIVNAVDGKPARGVVITAAGVSATSNGEGLWQLSHTLDSGSTTVDVTVQAPGQSAYVIRGFPVRRLTMRGDVQNVGSWTSIPYARFEATLVLAGSGAPAAGAGVIFTPTGGAPVQGVVTSGYTNGNGTFDLELSGTGALGSVVGTLLVTLPDGSRVSRFEGFAVPLSYLYAIPRPTATFEVGGRRIYGGEVEFRGTGVNVPGARVLFTRTGGVAMNPASVQVLADGTGFFVLSLDRSTEGAVVGDLTVGSPDGTKSSTYHGVSLATYDSTSLRSMGLWAYGERWAWAVELWTNAQLAPAPNVAVEFHHTGGLATVPDTIRGRTGSDGRFELHAQVTDTGTVLGELEVFPAVGPPRIIPNIALRTFEGDDLRFGGVFGFGPALRYVGEVLLQDGTPVVGAQVTWTQVSGIPASPTTLTMTTDASGRFPLTLIPSMDGEVVGTVQVVPPAPWTAGSSFTFTNLRLNSFESGDLRLAVTYRIPAP